MGASRLKQKWSQAVRVRGDGGGTRLVGTGVKVELMVMVLSWVGVAPGHIKHSSCHSWVKATVLCGRPWCCAAYCSVHRQTCPAQQVSSVVAGGTGPQGMLLACDFEQCGLGVHFMSHDGQGRRRSGEARRTMSMRLMGDVQEHMSAGW